MLKISNLSKGLKLALLGSVLCATFILASPQQASADHCGVNTGSTHSMAGLIVEMYWWPYTGGTLVANNTQVYVKTKLPSSTTNGNNIVRLNSTNTSVIASTSEATFNQYNSGCGDGTNVVLGYHVTSSRNDGVGGPWALDCDMSIHPSYAQEFEITGIGVPSGARAGGTWEVKVVAPPNGSTTTATLAYSEPPPPTTTLQGRVFDPNTFGGYAGITIETCQGQVTTDGSGSFYKTANVGTGFCIRAVGGVPSGYAVLIRPWSEEYPGQSPGCPGFNSSTSSPLVNGKNYCAQGSYECQIAGQLSFGFCGVNWDRSWDGGYDIVLIPPSTFEITPVPNDPLLSPDSENPTSARFVSGITVTVTPPTGNGVKATLTRSYFIRRGASTIAISPAPSPSPDSDGNKSNGTPPNDPFNSFNYASETRTLSGARLGDRICVSLTTNPHRGTVDGNGNVVSVSSASNTVERCTPVSNKPYLKVFGGSVWAGSEFNDGSAGACAPPFVGGNIQTYARYNGGASFGSSAQYAAQAMRRIVGDTIGRGFSSASQRIPPSSSGPGYLTVANRFWNASPPDWGGNFIGGRCLVDFYDTGAKNTRFSSSTTALPSSDINNLTSNTQYQASGPVTLTASGGITSKRVTIYVNGDVSIPNNIEYCSVASCETRVYSPSDLDDPADPADADNIPYVTIIARGNIYIGRNVETISGLYIAQPNTTNPTTGEIFTCASGFAAIPVANRFTDCNGPGGINPLLATCNGGSSGNNTGKPLTIYGAFIARKTHFDRTNGTLRCASSVFGVPFPEPFASEKMAERFYLTPELYLGQPVFRSQATNNNSIGEVQSYSNLPPIF